jgi:hypothetical protein
LRGRVSGASPTADGVDNKCIFANPLWNRYFFVHRFFYAANTFESAAFSTYFNEFLKEPKP